MLVRIMFSVSCAVRKMTVSSGSSSSSFSAARIPAVVVSISISSSAREKSGLPGQLHRLRARGRLRHHAHILLGVQRVHKVLAYEVEVLGDKYVDHGLCLTSRRVLPS